MVQEIINITRIQDGLYEEMSVAEYDCSNTYVQVRIISSLVYFVSNEMSLVFS